MEYIIAKLLLPIILPMLIASAKVAIEKFTPELYGKIPKQVWLALIPVLAEASAQYSPDLFLFPGLPSWASTAIYSIGSAGSREFMTQVVKLANGDLAPSTTVFTKTASPSGI